MRTDPCSRLARAAAWTPPLISRQSSLGTRTRTRSALRPNQATAQPHRRPSTSSSRTTYSLSFVQPVRRVNRPLSPPYASCLGYILSRTAPHFSRQLPQHRPRQPSLETCPVAHATEPVEERGPRALCASPPARRNRFATTAVPASLGSLTPQTGCEATLGFSLSSFRHHAVLLPASTAAYSA